MEYLENVSYDDFLEFSVEELKYFLRQRGHTVTGSKRDLAARALVSYEKNEKPQKDNELQNTIVKEYQENLDCFGLFDPLTADGWEDDITSWPLVDLGKIFHYIISKKAFEADYVGQYKVKKAYSYFKSGFVAQVLSLKLTGGHKDKILLKTSVLPSQKVNSAEHTVWVLTDKGGDVLTAYCACTAGLSHCCNHVIAVLYKIEYAVSQGLTNPTCTGVKCRFNDRSKRVIKGCRVNDVVLEKHIVSKKLKKQSICSKMKTAFDPRHGNRSFIDEKCFFDELSVIRSNASVLMSLPGRAEGLTPPPLPKVAEVILSRNDGVPYEKLVEELLAEAVLTDV